MEIVGHAVGGVCPFAVKPGVKTCLDVSLQRFTTVFPACTMFEQAPVSGLAITCMKTVLELINQIGNREQHTNDYKPFWKMWHILYPLSLMNLHKRSYKYATYTN